jgi:hypothetical protein
MAGGSIFRFLRNLHAALIYIPTNSIEVLLSPTSSPALVVVCVTVIAILTGVR